MDNRTMESKEVNAVLPKETGEVEQEASYSPSKGFRYRRQQRDHSLHSPSRNEVHLQLRSMGTRGPDGNKDAKHCHERSTGTHIPKRAYKRSSARPQLDTGADSKMISRRTFKDMKPPTLDRSTFTVKTAVVSVMNALGSFNTAFIIIDRKE